MEELKTAKNTRSILSSREISAERSNTKNEKTLRKIILSTFEKRCKEAAKLCRRRFKQYIKMTQNIDLNVMTNDRDILQEHRDELEYRIKDLFIWALGESAITEMTRTVRDNNLIKMEKNLITVSATFYTGTE